MMLHETPLRKRHAAYVAEEFARAARADAASSRPGAATGHRLAAEEVEYLPYGSFEGRGEPACEIPASFSAVEAEYAALRRAAGLMDYAHRGTLRVTGADRRDFLDRMITQELKDLDAGGARESFWLNRKGRIDADLLLAELGNEMLIDVDIHRAAHCVTSLGEFILADDVSITDCSDEFHHIALHGPAAPAVLADAGGGELRLEPLQAARISVSGVDVVLARRDQIGEIGLELFVPYDQAEAVWDTLLASDGAQSDERRRVRPVGWYAYNTARIEAGTPLFNIDFGGDNLPHETGVLQTRVSFSKGCYLGQEIVTRLETQGRPKRLLVGLRMTDDLLPVAGSPVFEKTDDGPGEIVGAITSSTISPMLGAAPIALAMLKIAHAERGAAVLITADGKDGEAIVGPLRLWPVDPSA